MLGAMQKFQVVSQDPPKPIAELYGTHQDVSRQDIIKACIIGFVGIIATHNRDWDSYQLSSIMWWDRGIFHGSDCVFLFRNCFCCAGTCSSLPSRTFASEGKLQVDHEGGWPWKVATLPSGSSTGECSLQSKRWQAEYLFFYIPTTIILGLCIPAWSSVPNFEHCVRLCQTVSDQIPSIEGWGGS